MIFFLVVGNTRLMQWSLVLLRESRSDATKLGSESSGETCHRDEFRLMVKDSEILLLPCKEDDVIVAETMEVMDSPQNSGYDAAVFDMEYSRWLEEDHRIICDLRLWISIASCGWGDFGHPSLSRFFPKYNH